MPTRKPNILETNPDQLTDEQKREILSDPELKKEILNSEEAKEEIKKLVDSEEISKVIKEEVAKQVGSQTQRIPDSQKKWGFIKVSDRHYKTVEI